MRSRSRLFLHSLALAAVCALPGWAARPAMAQSVTTQAEAAVDPPGRVGRLSDLQGQVWLYHPDAGDWATAERNRPLTSGDRLATDAGARAEVRIGSTTLRLDSGSELEVLRLDDDRIALQLHSGSAAVRLRSRESVPEFELRTGEGRFTVQRTGRYRFDRIDEASHVSVLSGQALYEGQGSALSVNAGQHTEFWIDASNVAQYRMSEPARDAFASWTAERDRADDRSAATRYVSPEMTGVEDLDRYGRWEDSPDYGPMWIPRTVVAGWAPYTTGHWARVAPWGWTWVDDSPWGFAPFHYGRWVYASSNWCWVPGTYVRRPVYAPALVAWVGGPRLSVSISVGAGGHAPAVGWVPLAPREVFVPGYRVSPGYVRNVNITHVTNITNITTIVNNPQQAVADHDYGNRKFPHAVTVVPATVLSSHQPVGPAAQQWRDSPGARAVINEPPRSTVVAAPPIPAPPPVVRQAGAPVSLPPGVKQQPQPVVRDRAPVAMSRDPSEVVGRGAEQPRTRPGRGDLELSRDAGPRPLPVQRPAPAPTPAPPPAAPPAVVAAPATPPAAHVPTPTPAARPATPALATPAPVPAAPPPAANPRPAPAVQQQPVSPQPRPVFVPRQEGGNRFDAVRPTPAPAAQPERPAPSDKSSRVEPPKGEPAKAEAPRGREPERDRENRNLRERGAAN